MPPRLPALVGGASPSHFIQRVARPFSTTSAAQFRPNNRNNATGGKNPAFNILSLDNNTSRSTDGVRGLVRDRAQAQAEAKAARRREEMQFLEERKTSDDYVRQMPRKWRTGEVYAPQDMHPHQLAKHRRNFRETPKKDVLDTLNVNPLDMYRNFSMISEFMTTAGQIKGVDETGLRPRNQRRMAKAIRRVIGMGIHPSVHHHPELLRRKLKGQLR